MTLLLQHWQLYVFDIYTAEVAGGYIMKNLLSFNFMPTIKPVEVPREYEDEFIQELMGINIKREKLLSFILIAVILVLLCIDALSSDLWTKDIYVFGKFSGFHVILLLAPFIFLLLIFAGERFSITSLWFYRIAHLFLVTAVLTFCSLIADDNVAINKQLFAYTIAMFCISSLVLLKTWEMYIIYIYSYLVYIIHVGRACQGSNDFYGNLIYLGILIILALVASNTNYSAYLKSFIDKKAILNKNAELKELSTLLEATFDSIPDIIAVKNTDLELIHCNKAIYRYFNVDGDTVFDHKCYEFFGQSKVCENCIIKDVVNTKKPARVERYIDYLGSWLEIRAYPILDDLYNVIKVIEHIRDITAQKQIEMELQRSNSILKAQQEASLDGILITDRNGQALSWNNKFTDLLNIPENALKVNDKEGILKYVLLNITDEKELFGRLEKIYLSDFKSSCEKIQLKNGTFLDIYSAPILLFQGEAYGRVWYFRDITEKEIMDEALRKSAEENEKLLLEAKKYDELKSEFFSNISHELRTPLNVILASIQLSEFIMKNDSTKSTDKWNKNMKTIKQNCFRLLRLVNNLIDVTKIDAGFHELRLQPMNIINLVEEITLSVAEYARGKGISTQFDTDIEEKVVCIDPDKIERIMLNLLSNAIKFTESNGDILVNIHDRGDSILISVKDSGIGIPRDKQEIIFQRFRQVEQSLTRKYEGSGIGLSLVQSLVELHSGKIHVQSEVGAGSEFIIELPAKVVIEDEYKQVKFNYKSNHVENMHIEFSDIYN